LELQNARDVDVQVRSPLRPVLDAGHEALDQLSSCNTRQLYGAAIRVLGSHDDAEDALQDGLLAALRKLKSFEGRSQFSTWLTRIVFNAALMHIRTTRRHIAISLDRPGDGQDTNCLADKIADWRRDPEEAYARREQIEILRESLDRLPETYRSAVQLYDIQGLTTAETARILGLSIGAVKSRIHRAHQKLSKEVGKAFRPRIDPLDRNIGERSKTRQRIAAVAPFAGTVGRDVTKQHLGA
jgi:RNA polymerase sigma-70 factor, ECF subfamily